MGPDIDARRAAAAIPTPPPLDEGLGRFIDALAVALARRDHEADLAARRQPQDRTADAPRRDLQPVQL